VARELISDLDPERVRANLTEIRERIGAAALRGGRDPAGVQICVAGKYIATEALGALAQAGVTLVGENRAQELETKVARWGDTFTWDFIGHLQSRKVRQVLPHVRLLHAVSSDSVLAELAKHAEPEREILVEVNVAGEASKSGVAPEELAAFVARCPVRVAGLMTMPPLAADPEDSRSYFAALRDLAAAQGLAELSMGTTQDYEVAVEEGATIVRIGTNVVA
jgi:pyridoxal phosphate enzyme (YggS family)